MHFDGDNSKHGVREKLANSECVGIVTDNKCVNSVYKLNLYDGQMQ